MPGRIQWRSRVRLAVALTVFLALSLFRPVLAQIHFDLPAQPLAQALTSVGGLANLNVYFDARTVEGVRAPALRTEASVDDALAKLLAGTRLHAVRVDSNTVRVVADPPSTRAQGDSPASSNRDSFGMVHLALADTPPVSDVQGLSGSQTSSNTDAASQSRRATISEIVVTAQKREERLQDVPVPVSAISADSLVTNNQLLLKDYFSSVPGLSVTPQASGSFQTLSIRGITTGVYANPTVGITVDDAPFGTSTSNGGGGSGQIVPDVDPADLARVEVLRGPQGTLYGASSMGGLMKLVTIDPSTDRVSGRIQADLNGVYHGTQPGLGVRASTNVPLGDNIAVRASTFARQDPGYIDNVQTGERGVNQARAYGGRLALLWKPEEDTSLKVSALFQDIKGYGQPEVDLLPGLGGLQQSHLRDTGSYDRRLQTYSAAFKTKLGKFDLTSITGYNIMQFADSYDISFLSDTYDTQQYGVDGLASTERDRTRKVTEEVRLSGPIGSRLDWLIGGFYTYEKSDFKQRLPALDVNSGAEAGLPLGLGFVPTFMELAAFTDLTVQVTDQFDVQLGARESQIRQTFSDFFEGDDVPAFYGSASPYIQPQLDSKANAFTYLVTPRLKLSPELMIYARLASGYRAGGANYSAGPGAPNDYAPDKTYNYEIGLKGDFLDHILSVDASVYYIDWRSIQLTEFNPDTGIGYITNASGAKSQGIELALTVRPMTGLQVSGWVSFDDAKLKTGFPITIPGLSAYGAAGDRLPYSSRVSANLSVQQDFPLSGSWSGFVGGEASYVGNRLGEFTQSPERQHFPGYVKTDLRVGAKSDDWALNLFVNNVTDQRGTLYGGLGAFPPFGFVYIQPRTTGLSIVRSF